MRCLGSVLPQVSDSKGVSACLRPGCPSLSSGVDPNINHPILNISIVVYYPTILPYIGNNQHGIINISWAGGFHVRRRG